MNDDEKTAREILCTDTGQTAYKRQLAYRRLGIDPSDVQRIPFYSNHLRRIARRVRSVAGIRPLDCLGWSEDPEARKVWNVYRSVPRSYRRLLPAEAFCHVAGVDPWKVLEIIAGVAVRQGAQAVAIVAAINHPRVVQKTVEMALQDNGYKERLIMHKATGFIDGGATLSAVNRLARRSDARSSLE